MIFAPQDVALIAVVGFILFGPKKLPEMAKSLGSSIVEFKKAMKGNKEEAAETPAENPAPTEEKAALPKSESDKQQLALPASSLEQRK